MQYQDLGHLKFGFTLMGDVPIYEELGMYLRKLIYKKNGAIYTFILRRNQLV